MSPDLDKRAGSDVRDLRTFLFSRRVLRTPSEVFTLPVEAAIKANTIAGLSAYGCIFDQELLHRVILDLDYPKIIPKNEALQVRWRGVPNSIHFTPSFGRSSKEVFDPKIEITVLGYLNSTHDYKHRYECWAFIDSVQK